MGGLNFAVLVKGAERYTFVWDDENSAEVLKAAWRFARNSELSFTQKDALSISQRVGMLAMQALLETR